ncbi:MAG: quinone-dependent dihydroorotate dehydrogenase [Proteobacteria bacterium]|nr:quinone-dependent dihydroorotate dehydrogenase [Pseudomonadota bacterium]
MSARPFDLIRPVLFALDPERAHALTLGVLRSGLLPARRRTVAGLETTIAGLRFPNPVGLAAGFDKNAVATRAMLKTGFGFVEAGTVTPKPQKGNPRPRVFRSPRDDAVINRLGFNNDGHETFARNMRRQRNGDPGIIGINVGANRDAKDPIQDYVDGVLRFSDLAHYLVVNISSPNTPGLRDLQARAKFGELLNRLRDARSQSERRPPLLVKIAPDLAPNDLGGIVEIAIETGIDGLVVSNTTVDRPPFLAKQFATEAGGLSGRPLFARSTEVLRDAFRLSQGRLPLIGVGGVWSGEDAYTKIKAGASLVQLYTGLIFQGPDLVHRILLDLRQLMDRDGVRSLSEVVGVEGRQ